MKVAMLSLLVFMVGFSLAHAQAGQPVAPPEPSGEGLGTVKADSILDQLVISGWRSSTRNPQFRL